MDQQQLKRILKEHLDIIRKQKQKSIDEMGNPTFRTLIGKKRAIMATILSTSKREVPKPSLIRLSYYCCLLSRVPYL